MNIISKLFYTKEDYALLAMIEMISNNATHLAVDTDISINSYFHPNGIKQLFFPREFRIANAIAKILSGLSQNSKNERIQALQSLQEESLYAVPLVCRDLRYNTARVLVKVMKELIRARGNIAKQLHLAHSFQRAARGNLFVVRKLLQEYHLLEMPEAYNQLSFDHHVHDMYSKGYKSPSQVVLDAWIQGVKDITLVYYNYAIEEAIEELFEAGQILDIKTNFGIEYHIPMYDTFAQVVWSPLPQIQRLSTVKTFFAQEHIQEAMQQGRAISDSIASFTESLLERYNLVERFVIEHTYQVQTKPIDKALYLNYVNKGQSSPQFLAEYIYKTIIEDVHNIHSSITLESMISFIHTLSLNVQKSPFAITKAFAPEDVYQFMQTLYNRSPESNICLHMSDLTAIDVLIMLWAAKGTITHLELFNLKDWLYNKQPQAYEVSRLQYAINTKDIQEMKRLVRTMIQECSISTIEYKKEKLEILNLIFKDIPTILQSYTDKQLAVRLGSDSSGSINREYTMGFVFEETIPSTITSESRKRAFTQFPIFAKLQHSYNYTQTYGAESFWNTKFGRVVRSIPLMRCIGQKKTTSWSIKDNLYEIVPDSEGVIIGTGRISEEKSKKPKKYPHPITDLNNTVLCYIKFAIAIAVAFLTFHLSQKNIFLKYCGGFAWLGITVLRLVFQTMYAVGFGYKWFEYTHSNIILPRVADLLLGTGIAVFIIEYIMRYLILQRMLGIDVTSHPVLVYSVIAGTSALVILGIGRIRGLPKEMVFASASRIILALPVALLYTWIFMHILGVFNIHIEHIDALTEASATLIAKCASETVVGILIGMILRSTFIKARLWDYTKTIHALFKEIDILEERYPDQEITFLLKQPSVFLSIIKKDNNDILTSIYVNLLDLFYFWYYLPLARRAFHSIVKKQTPSNRKLLASLIGLLEYTDNLDTLFHTKKEYLEYTKFVALYKREYPHFIETMKKLLLQ